MNSSPFISTRRTFIGRSLLAGAAPLILPGRVLGLDGTSAPSSRIRIGIIGFGSRAQSLLPVFLSFGEVQVAAISECRADRMNHAKQRIDKHYGNSDCLTFPDFQEMLARPDIDAVFIATGNRWHGVASIYAARAGKDIYCEKPVTLSIHEGRALADTCRQYGTIYQAGTQRRATSSYQFARETVLAGRIGRLREVEMQVWAMTPVPHDTPSEVPKGWDYDRWLGPSPWRPFTRGRTNLWQSFWETADGNIADMGSHYTDQMQWTLGQDASGPVAFETTGVLPDPERFMSDVPITATARCRYADGVKGTLHQRGPFHERYIRYIGDEGWIQVDDESDRVTAEPKSLLGFRRRGGAGWSNPTDHIADFLNGIRTRRAPSCHAEVAHRAMTISQAMNISLRVGRPLNWDPVREQFDLPEANRLIRREPRAPWRIV